MAGAGTFRCGSANEQEERRFSYWLGHSEGFLVEAAAGRIGLVEEIRRRSGEPSELLVRAGRLGLRELAIPADAVASIAPRQRRLTLTEPVTITASRPRPQALLRPAR